MASAQLVFTLPGSALQPLIVLEGAPVARRSQEGTYQRTGRNSSGVPEFSNDATKTFTWRVSAFLPVAKSRLFEDYLYAQDEGTLGSIVVDDLNWPIRNTWLNWGNRVGITPLPVGIAAPPAGSSYVRTFCAIVVEPEADINIRAGIANTTGDGLIEVAFTAFEVPS